MNARIATAALSCLLLPIVGCCQTAQLRLPDLHSLAGKATESVNIHVGPWLLHAATRLMDDEDADEASTKAILGRIHSIEIRSYEFATDFAYSKADIDAVRRQLTGPGWTPLVQVHDRAKNEDVDICLLIENNRSQGFALIASEPRQFTIINIVGSIDMADLPKIESYLHLPAAESGLGDVDFSNPVSGKPVSDAGRPANSL